MAIEDHHRLKNNFAMENFRPIDFNSDDDFLVANSPQDFRLSAMKNKDEHKNFTQFVSDKSAAEIFDKRAEKFLLSRSNVSGRTTNSRDSLAWDSAFFTNGGVLDPDELFAMNKGFEKVEARKRKSTYSEYMFDTDGFFLESNPNTEADLFQDVRASIQKSSTRTNMFSEPSNMKNYISKKLDYMSSTKVKPMPTARKQSVKKRGSERTEKRIANPVIAQLREKTGKLKSFSPKPPRISGRVNPTSSGLTRNVPRSVDNAKIQHRSMPCSSGIGLISSKKSRLGKSSGSNCSISSLTTSSSLSVAESSDSTSSCSPFVSVSSVRTSTNLGTRKGSWKNRLYQSVSTFRTPPRCSLQVQNNLECPDSSTYLSSLSNHSSYDSTPSTIDKCSIESPSITCINTDHSMIPSKRNGDACAELTRGSRPSCLKMPSPKIGFFDEEHSSADFQFHTGSQSSSTVIRGVKPKTMLWISTPDSSQKRGLSSSLSATCGYSERKPVISKSPKPLSKVASMRSYPAKGVLENRIEQERKKCARVSTISGRLTKNKPFPQRSGSLLLEENKKENLSGFEDHVDGLSRYFEGINLKGGIVMDKLPNDLSKPRARMPLADTKCVCNGINNRR